MFYDFVVSGGGLAGSLAALALKKLGFSCYIFDSAKKYKSDFRTSTITKSSADFLKEINAWQHIKDFATPILGIYTYEKNSASFLHFDCTNKDECATNKSPMGWVVPNNILKHALQKEIKINYGVSYKEVYSSCDKSKLILSDANTLEGRFLISAEGRESFCLKTSGILNFSRFYKQSCIICNLKCDSRHKNIAREIFLPEGPLALLPLKKEDEFSLIWTVDFLHHEQIKNLKKEVFLEKISKISGLNFVDIITERIAYPIKIHMAKNYFKKSIIFVGDCMHSIHPVAGQGFNLTVYDIRSIFQLLSRYDLSDFASLLPSYSKQRLKTNAKMAFFTDLLVRCFSNNSYLLETGRNLALDLINNNLHLKNFFTNRAMGVDL